MGLRSDLMRAVDLSELVGDVRGLQGTRSGLSQSLFGGRLPRSKMLVSVTLTCQNLPNLEGSSPVQNAPRLL